MLGKIFDGRILLFLKEKLASISLLFCVLLLWLSGFLNES